MSRLVSLALALFLIAAAVISLPQEAYAQSKPTQAQLEQFKKLPRAQQEALARQYGISLSDLERSSGNQQGEIRASDTVSERANNTDTETDRRALNELSPGELEKRLAKDDEEIAPFGYSLFQGEPSTFAPISNAPVPSNYLIGVGDTLRIQLYGKESSSYDAIVDREGRITVGQLGPMSVAGLRYDEVKELIRATVSERMIGIEAAVSIGELRSMQVFVVGEAYKPGAYTVSSLTTISQALFVSGGVSDIASLRSIQLKRGGETVKTFDLYDLLTKGDASDDALLRDGDVVFIPPRGEMITVRGEVMRPAQYELKGNETLADVVELAGGLLPNAYRASAQLQRVANGSRIIETVNLNTKADSVKMRGGDDLDIGAVAQRVSEGVMLVGAVTRPGTYEVTNDMRVSDLLPGIDSALLPVADLGYGLVVRPSEDRRRTQVLQFDVAQAISGKAEQNLALQSRDQVVIFSRYESAMAEKNQLESFLRTESERARIQREEVLELYREQYLQKLVGNRADNFNDSDQPDRLRELDKELASLFETEPSEKEGDKETVKSPSYYSKFSRYNLLQPILYQLRNQYTATGSLNLFFVDGEVRYPGVYPLAVNATARDAIAAAGGLKESAYLARAEITRTLLSDGEAVTDYVPFELGKVLSGETQMLLNGRDRVNILSIPDWQNTLQVRLEGEVRFPGTYTIRRGETLKTLLERAGGLTDYAFERGAVFTRADLRETEQRQLEGLAQQLRREIASNVITDTGGNFAYGELNQLLRDLTNIEAIGRLVVDLDAIMANGSRDADLQLKDGDRLFVPTSQNTVSIIGEVQLASSYRYDGTLSLDDYIERAGGLRQKADDSRVYIVKADGSISVPDRSGWFNFKRTSVEPGDTIVVPLDTQYVNNIEVWSTATQIMYQVGVALAAVSSL
ncbi:protein involved in polysaccharide export, contains SLBB domain of the beta-grasp fold [Pseudidiomarina planktonica]|uniref:Protein involved in polysaccharide export, contains SLBB domain of the beta-grasp fold n=1 Tax=Pseudidiomarina planktonica TaxID=1323738 RepID=A0A1Y6EGM7_9GAMM|nr:SLBB domain-containing protein [Pseudidiomarina planktonica]RUO65923.1 polysaccharide biosynthesis protein [Pseudidiomarina planktonica]SMQ61778.1 protein involved in polysaccharide export, contains SLBB domain of the beta-grasp fold [Pseudidiomarina planktonica]